MNKMFDIENLRNELAFLLTAISLLLAQTAFAAEANMPRRQTMPCIEKIAAQKLLGRVGVSAVDLKTGVKFSLNGAKNFPMQSVFKLPLAVTVMQMVDEKKLSLQQKITIKRSDLSVLYSPLADKFRGKEQVYTIDELLHHVIQSSDNTACDVLLDTIGGPKVVQESLKSSRIKGLSVDRYEREIQPELLGIHRIDAAHPMNKAQWQIARTRATGKPAQEAFDFYLNRDPRDCSTPEAMTEFLGQLYYGVLISKKSTDYLLGLMEGTKTGPNRIKAAVPKGGKLAHKTGTGPDFQGINAATNDVGIITLPSGRHIAIAIFVAGSKMPERQRENAMRDIAACIVQRM